MAPSSLDLVRVNVCGSVVEAGKDGEGKVHVVVKRMCEDLGVDVENQRKKLKEAAWATTVMITAVAEDGKIREVFCIDLESLVPWLMSIHPSKVKPEVRPRLIALVKDARRVLAEHFFGRRQEDAVPPQFLRVLDELAGMMRAQNDAVAELRGEVQALKAQHAAEAADPGGMIGRAEGRRICDRMQRAAIQLHANGDAKTLPSARGIVESKIRSSLRFAGIGKCWEYFPCSRRDELEAALRMIEQDVRRTAGVAKARAKAQEEARQMGLPFIGPRRAGAH